MNCAILCLICIVFVCDASFLLNQDVIYSWGGNVLGQLGREPSGSFLSDPHASNISKIFERDPMIQFSLGYDHALFLTQSRKVYAIGSAGSGKLGRPDVITFTSIPIPINSSTIDGEDIVAVAAGYYHSVLLTANGLLYTFGDEGINNLLGRDLQVPSNVPGLVPFASYNEAVIRVWAGSIVTVILTEKKRLLTFGPIRSSLLGRNSSESIGPIALDGPFDVTDVAIGLDFVYVLLQNGSIINWGNNDSGQLTQWHSPESYFIPKLIPNLPKMIAISAGKYHVVMLDEKRRVLTVGRNDRYQLGRFLAGSAISDGKPTQIISLDIHNNISSISAGGYFSMLLTENGDIFSWGDNSLGQLGRPGRLGTLEKPGKLNLPSAISIRASAGDFAYAVLLKTDIHNLTKPPIQYETHPGKTWPVITIVSIVGVFLFLIMGCALTYVGYRIYISKKTQKIMGQVPTPKITRELHDILVMEPLGSGKFGEVFKGLWQGKTFVALKKMKAEFLWLLGSEVKLLETLDHPNIVSFLGMYTDSQGTKYMVTEYMPQGSLHSYLIQHPEIPISQLTDMALQAAAGMHYLEGKQIVHRDLALRNLLIHEIHSNQFVVKVADFGLSQSVNEDHYRSLVSRCCIPVKWTSPESLQYGIFSTKSDVWAFAITLWEIFSYGKTPYPTLSNEEVLEKVLEGYRLPNPKDCPDEIYTKVMLPCWNSLPEHRPNFRVIFHTLMTIKNQHFPEDIHYN